MREYPLRLVEAVVATRRSLGSIESRAHLSSSRENRRQRVAELMEGKRQFAGRLGSRRQVDYSAADGNAGVGVKP